MNKIILALTISFFTMNAHAWRESNGGNGVVAEAHMFADSLIKEMHQVPALLEAYHLRPYAISAKENLTLNGQPVDAVTEIDWDKEYVVVFINASTWDKLSYTQKRTLILHELTHFMSRIDDNYTYSRKVLDMLTRNYEIQNKHRDSDFPLEEEVINSIDNCSLRNFTKVYDLLGSLDYKLELKEQKQTLGQYIEASTCKRIKDQVKK